MKTAHTNANLGGTRPLGTIAAGYNRRNVLSLLFVLMAMTFLTRDVVFGQCADQPAGLVAWWRGEGNALDALGHGSGTIHGGVSFAPGMVGQAFSFDGQTGYVELPGLFGGGTEYTVEAWVRSAEGTGGFQAIISSTATDEFLHFQLSDAGNIAVYCFPPGIIYFNALSPAPYGVWRHVALSIRSGDSRLYVDGQMIEQQSTTFDQILPTASLRMGSGFNGERFFKGEIDELSIFNRALTEPEIQAIYNAGAAGKCAPAGLEVTTVASRDTMITEHPFIGGPASVHGADASLHAVGSPGWRSYPLVAFDLSSFAGQTVVGSPRFEFWLDGGWSTGVARPLSLHAVLIPWDETTTSWETFGGAPDTNPGVVAADIATEFVTFSGTETGYRSWSIPASVVQAWIDNPAANFGLLVQNNYVPVQQDLVFQSREGTHAPRLVFETAPCTAPQITVQPTAQTACPHTEVTFTVLATGSDLSYQWIKNGEDLLGETDSTLTINPVQAVHAGQYRVRVQNTCGVELSTAATLSGVDNPPVVTLNGATLITLEACSGTYTELGATATDDCTSSISVTIGGETVNTSVPDTYEVTYTATDGSLQTTTVTRTVIVQDTTPPVLANVPGDLTVDCNAADKQQQIDNWLASVTASDTCGSATVQSDFAGMDDCDSGSRIVTWTATDGNGRTAAVSRTLTIAADGMLTGVQFSEPALQLALTANGIHSVNITVVNNGDCPTVIQAAAIAASFDSPVLTVTSPTFPATVCPGENVQLAIQINTMGALEGNYPATLSLGGSAGGSLSLPIELLISGQLLPDITANYSGGGVSVTPGSPGSGLPFTINAKVKNIGTAAAGPFTVKFFEGANLLGAADVSDLAINASTTAELEVPAGFADGFYLIRVEVVPPVSGELRLKNNTASMLLQVGAPAATTVAVQITASVTPNCDLSAAILNVRAEYVFVSGGSVFTFPMQGAGVNASILSTEIGVTGIYTDVNGNLSTSIGLPAAGDYLVGVQVTDSSITSQDNFGLEVPATPDCVQGGEAGETGSPDDSGGGGRGGGGGGGPVVDLYVCSGDIFFRDANGVILTGSATPGTTVQLCANVHYYTETGAGLAGQPVRFVVRQQNAGEVPEALNEQVLANYEGGGSTEVRASWNVPPDGEGTYSVLVSVEPNVTQNTANDKATRGLVVGTPSAPNNNLQVTVTDFGGCNGAGLWVSGRATYLMPTLPVNCGQVSVTSVSFGTDPDNTVPLSTATRGGFKTDAAGNFKFQTDIALPTGRNEISVTVTDGTLTRTTTFSMDCASPGVSDATDRDLFLYAEHIAFLGDNCLAPLTRNPLPSESISVNAAIQYWDNNIGTLLNADVPVQVNVLVPIGNELVATTIGGATAAFDGTTVEVVCVPWTPTVSGPQLVQVVIDPDEELPFTEYRGNNFATRLIHVGQLDCLLTAIPQSAQVQPGQSANYGLIGEKLGDLSPTLDLTVIPDTSTFPPGVVATLGANQMTLPDETTLTLSTTAATPPGAYFFNVVGTGDNCSVLARVKLVVVDNTPPPDTTDPEIQCPAPVQLVANGNCLAVVPDLRADAMVSDDRTATENIVVTQIPAPGTVLALGNHSIELTATDEAGNTATCTTSVTVVDETNPQIACPASVQVVADANCQAAVPNLAGQTQASDCNSPVTVTQSPAVGAPLTLGVHTITLTATDAAGNSSSCAVQVTVVDQTAPVVTLLGGTTMTVECHSTFTDPGATALDNCAGNLTASIIASGSVNVNAPGQYSLTYTVTDPAGNIGSATRTVNVVDTTAPVVTLLGGSVITVECHGAFTDPGATASDACAGTLSVATTGSVDVNTPGTYVLSYTATDPAGNNGSATRTVQVVDTTAPSFVCPNPVQLPAAENGEAQTPDFLAQLVVNEDCSATVTAQQSPAAGIPLPAGTHQVIITAADAAGNQSICSVSVTVSAGDNTPPVVTIEQPESGVLSAIGQGVQFLGTFTDDGSAGTHTAQWIISGAMLPETTIPGAVIGFTVSDTIQFPVPGVYSIKLMVTDAEGASGDATKVLNDLPAYVVVYDPNGGFVTGGGWIWSPPGAFHPGLEDFAPVEGKANFGFVSKYLPGAKKPSGQTQFNFQAGGLNFHSGDYQWLVVAGARAQYKGTGTINGAGVYGFMVTAIDGQINGGGGKDRFRIKIWDARTGIIIYDNQAGSGDADDLNDATILRGGSIVIHKR